MATWHHGMLHGLGTSVTCQPGDRRLSSSCAGGTPPGAGQPPPSHHPIISQLTMPLIILPLTLQVAFIMSA
jgi:hypothetical protein